MKADGLGTEGTLLKKSKRSCQPWPASTHSPPRLREEDVHVADHGSPVEAQGGIRRQAAIHHNEGQLILSDKTHLFATAAKFASRSLNMIALTAEIEINAMRPLSRSLVAVVTTTGKLRINRRIKADGEG